MRKPLIIIAAVLAGAISAQARIYETYEQCVARYGAPTKTMQSPEGPVVEFSKNRIHLTVMFYEKKAYLIIYQKDGKMPDSEQSFSYPELDTLFAANGSSRVWKRAADFKFPNDQRWKTTDSALLGNLVMSKRMIIIHDLKVTDKLNKIAEEKKKVRPVDLKGF